MAEFDPQGLHPAARDVVLTQPSLHSGTRRAFVALVLLLSAAILIALVLDPAMTVLALASDDAFYYFKIADSIARGAGSTFDGIAPTNGYHPLWMATMVGLFATGPAELYAVPAVALGLCVVQASVMLIGTMRLVDRFVAPGLGVMAGAVLLAPHSLAGLLNGMETSLAMLLVLGLLWFCYAKRPLAHDASSLTSLALGTLLGVVFLSRLDLVFLAIATGVLTVASGLAGLLTWRSMLLRAICQLGGFTLIVSPYLAANYVYFGHLMPISGVVKSAFPEVRNALHLEGDSFLGALMLASLAVLVAWTSLIGYRRSGISAVVSSPLVLVLLAALGHFLHSFLFLSWGVHWWHFALSGVGVAIALPAALAQQPFIRRSWLVPASLTVGVLAVTLQSSLIANRITRHEAWAEAANWARAHTPPDAIFAIKDAGLFGYLSQRRVVNLDGKANSYRYWEHVSAGQVNRYLQTIGVRYVADIDPGCRHSDCALKILQPNRPGVFIRLRGEDEVYRGEPYAPARLFSSETKPGVFMIWRYGLSGAHSRNQDKLESAAEQTS